MGDDLERWRSAFESDENGGLILGQIHHVAAINLPFRERRIGVGGLLCERVVHRKLRPVDAGLAGPVG